MPGPNAVITGAVLAAIELGLPHFWWRPQAPQRGTCAYKTSLVINVLSF